MPMYFTSYYRWLVIRKWMHLNASPRVLDVGCDDGEIIARVQATMRVGSDLNPRCPDPAVRLICNDAHFLPLASGSFDAVFAFDVIEHIENDRAVLSELVRILTDGGTLWMSTPSAGFEIFPRFLTCRANRGWGHVRNGYAPAEIHEKLPPGIMTDIMLWNEPMLRFLHVALRILDFSPALTCAVADWCYQFDRHFSQGLKGHLFIKVCKQVPSDGPPTKGEEHASE
jgi:SAM-dependent methyltransferase